MPRGGSRPGTGGARPGAGRKKSAPPEVKAMEKVLEAGEVKPRQFATAKEFAMWLINKDDADMEHRLRAMQAVLPYTDAKLAEAAPGKKEEKQARAEKAASKFAVPVPPKLVVSNP